MIDLFDGVNNDALLIEDCDGTPSPHRWLGDGYCDDGSDVDDGGGNFNCNIFLCDDGDCGDTMGRLRGRRSFVHMFREAQSYLPLIYCT